MTSPGILSKHSSFHKKLKLHYEGKVQENNTIK